MAGFNAIKYDILIIW